jgi:hypothetical protein
MSAKAIAVSLAGGIVGHIVLGLSYLVFKLTGSAAVMLTMDVACVLVPFLVAGVGSKFVGTASRQAARSHLANSELLGVRAPSLAIALGDPTTSRGVFRIVRRGTRDALKIDDGRDAPAFSICAASASSRS